MNYFFVLGSLFVVHLLALISPGPNILVVVQTAAGRTRTSGVAAALGVATGAAVWSGIALAGLNIVFAHTTWLYGGLRLVGGLYLIYLGVKLWRGAPQPLVASAGADTSGLGKGRAFRLGLLTTLTNPKAALFFAGVFTALLPPAAPLWLKWAAVGLIVIDSSLFHVGLACFFSTGRIQRAYNSSKIWLDRSAGLVLGVLGIRLLADSR